MITAKHTENRVNSGTVVPANTWMELLKQYREWKKAKKDKKSHG